MNQIDELQSKTISYIRFPLMILIVYIHNQGMAVSTCKCTARKVKEYFRKNTQEGYENLIFLSGDGLFCQ